MASCPLDRLSFVLNHAAPVFIDCIATDSDAEILASFLIALTSSFSSLPSLLSQPSRDNLIKAIETQFYLVIDREAGRRAEVEEEDDRLGEEDGSEYDADVWVAMSRALCALMKDQPSEEFPIVPVVSFIDYVLGGNSKETMSSDANRFALRLLFGLVKYIGRGPAGCERYLTRSLELLSDPGTSLWLFSLLPSRTCLLTLYAM